MATAVDKWPAYARLLAVAPAGHLPTAPTPPPGTRPRGRSHAAYNALAAEAPQPGTEPCVENLPMIQCGGAGILGECYG